MEIKEVLTKIYNAIDDKKGMDIKLIDISQISSLADYFVICGGDNINQVHAIADNVEEQLKKLSLVPSQIEGYQKGNWILMDYKDIVVHIFDKESRGFYNLDNIWRDGRFITL
ncbi:MAG TPA: ribosome silencing factor [Lachnospiraceae bacterium]|nr:ribosome silencing factor [Lachnospiraceae bacterium]